MQAWRTIPNVSWGIYCRSLQLKYSSSLIYTNIEQHPCISLSTLAIERTTRREKYLCVQRMRTTTTTVNESTTTTKVMEIASLQGYCTRNSGRAVWESYTRTNNRQVHSLLSSERVKKGNKGGGVKVSRNEAWTRHPLRRPQAVLSRQVQLRRLPIFVDVMRVARLVEKPWNNALASLPATAVRVRVLASKNKHRQHASRSVPRCPTLPSPNTQSMTTPVDHSLLPSSNQKHRPWK